MQFLFILALIVANFLYGNIDSSLLKQGQKEYAKYCMQCHAIKQYSFEELGRNFTNNNKILKLKGPVLGQLTFRLKQQLGDINDKDSQLFEITEYIKDYVKYPDKTKAVCMDVVIKNFQTMPSLKGKMSDEELDRISYFIYHSKTDIKH